MTPEQIKQWAREAGFEPVSNVTEAWDCFTASIERFAALVTQHEREQCAMVCEAQDNQGSVNQELMQDRCTAAIRARSEKGGER